LVIYNNEENDNNDNDGNDKTTSDYQDNNMDMDSNMDMDNDNLWCKYNYHFTDPYNVI
jgi:hypothetical protein